MKQPIPRGGTEPLKVDDRVQIVPEWQDPGDDRFERIVIEDITGAPEGVASSRAIRLLPGVKRFPDGTTLDFDVDPFSKMMLMAGTDEIGYVLGKDAEIAAWEAANPGQQWTVITTTDLGLTTSGTPTWPSA